MERDRLTVSLFPDRPPLPLQYTGTAIQYTAIGRVQIRGIPFVVSHCRINSVF